MSWVHRVQIIFSDLTCEYSGRADAFPVCPAQVLLSLHPWKLVIQPAAQLRNGPCVGRDGGPGRGFEQPLGCVPGQHPTFQRSPDRPVLCLAGQAAGRFSSCACDSWRVLTCLKQPVKTEDNISPSNEHPGLISFRMDWLDLPAVQGTVKSLLQHHSSKASILRRSAFFTVND